MIQKLIVGLGGEKMKDDQEKDEPTLGPLLKTAALKSIQIWCHSLEKWGGDEATKKKQKSQRNAKAIIIAMSEFKILGDQPICELPPF